MSKIIEVKNLSMKIKNKILFKEINFEIQKGEIVGLLGHNGVGKTRLLKQLGNAEFIQDGEVKINNQENTTNIKRRDVILLPDNIILIKNKSIEKNIKLFAEYYKLNSKFISKYMEKMELNLKDKVGEMSKGNQEMIQLILLLSIEADVYLLDEPFSAIDIFRRDVILDMIIDLNYEGRTFLITTHLINELEQILTRVIYLNNGKIDIDKNMDDIYESNNSLVEYLKNKYLSEKGA